MTILLTQETPEMTSKCGAWQWYQSLSEDSCLQPENLVRASLTPNYQCGKLRQLGDEMLWIKKSDDLKLVFEIVIFICFLADQNHKLKNKPDN